MSDRPREFRNPTGKPAVDGDAPMVVAMSGAGGLVGSAIAASLADDGIVVRRLVRRPGGPDSILWNPISGEIEQDKLRGAHALIHLAGESVGAGRWSPRRKRQIRESRSLGTAGLARAVASLSPPPAVFISASAVGWYGDRGEESLDEESGPGEGFLAETCRLWEAGTTAASEAGIRVVRLRIGVVLAAGGGALARMLPPFRAGLGGRLGDGRQFMSWIGLNDLVGVVRRVLVDASLAGPINAVAPEPVRNAEFARTLGRVLSRPAIFPLPALAIRTLFGEMGRELLLAGARVRPQRLLAARFRFVHPTLEQALRFELERPTRGADRSTIVES